MLKLLEEGAIIEFSGQLWRVVTVNDCRARIIPVEKKPVTIKGETFYVAAGGTDISPYSFVKIVTDYKEPKEEKAEAKQQKAKQTKRKPKAKSRK